MIRPIDARQPDAIPRVDLPAWLHQIDNPSSLDIGEKESLSMLMAVYAYSPDILSQLRNTQKLLQLSEAYLVKTGIWNSQYDVLYTDLWNSWIQACNVLASPQDAWAARVLFSDIERALTIVAKKEGFTQDSKELYDGRTGLEVSDPPAAGDDPYGL